MGKSLQQAIAACCRDFLFAILQRSNSFQGAGDDVIHVVVFVFCQAATEDDLFFFGGQGCILCVKVLVLFVVDRVIGFFAGMPIGWIFLGDVGDGLVAEFEVLVFDAPGVRRFAIRVVHDGHALVVFFFQALRFKAQAPVFEAAELVVEVGVDGASIDDRVSFGSQFFPMFQEVDA